METLMSARKDAVEMKKSIKNSIGKWYAVFAFCIFGVFESAYIIGKKTMAVTSIDAVWNAAKKAFPNEMRDLDI